MKKETVFYTDSNDDTVIRQAEQYMIQHQDTILDVIHKMSFRDGKKTREIKIIEEIELSDKEAADEMERLKKDIEG